MTARDERNEKTHTAPRWRLDVAAIVISLMAVCFALAVGPRLRSFEQDQARAQQEIKRLTSDVDALRNDLAQTRQDLQAARLPKRGGPDVEVTDAQGAALTPAEDIRSRLELLDARQARLTDRLDQLVRDLKASNVDLGLTERRP